MGSGTIVQAGLMDAAEKHLRFFLRRIP